MILSFTTEEGILIIGKEELICEQEVCRHNAGKSKQWSMPQFVFFVRENVTVVLPPKNSGR